ncbi:thioesterase family protein [Hahella sp. NBU794]|uniref:thioesterase family protein n=1 Tax=Hahella sp. NBU794 TaxID=3422590 RepID=UPI003D6E6787
MNLWFRLIKALFMAMLRKPAQPFDTTVVKMRVWPNDLDLNLHVNNGRYFTMADVGRIDYILRSGVGKVALKHRALPIVAEATAKFRKELRLFERFEIHSRLVGWDDKWSYMEHRFVRKGRVAGVVFMRGFFKGAQGAIKPEDLAEYLGVPSMSPLLPEWVTIWAESCDGLTESIRLEESIAVTQEQPVYTSHS